jgi:ribosome modulation factor
MRGRNHISLTAAERSAECSRQTKDDRLMTRAISRADDAGMAQRLDDAEAYTWSGPLDRYLEGWAEANPRKIFAATAHEYHFDDPLMGLFSRWSLPAYFERLQARFACAGAIVSARDLAFSIRGPVDGSPNLGWLTFSREAPLLGLTGVTLIRIGERGVIAEAVAYDLNLSLDVLRGGPRNAS